MCDKVDPNLIHFRSIEENDRDEILCFSSSNHSMDNFLKNEAYYNHISMEASTTLIFMNNQLVGYFTLRRKLIDLADGKEDNRECLDIARLAICEPEQRKGIGGITLQLVKELANMINERYITLDALYEKREWYRKRGFKPAIAGEYESGNEQSFVYMYLDFYDPKIVEEYFEV